MELVVLMGIPGSGKSTYYHREYVKTHLRLNMDQLNGSRNREQLLFYAALAGKTRMVVDNVNGTQKARQHYLAAAKAAGYSILGVMIYTPIEEALRRNAGREGKARIPEKAVLGHLARWENPDLAEGFDEIRWLDQDFGLLKTSPQDDHGR